MVLLIVSLPEDEDSFPATVGQGKHAASAAKDYFDSQLSAVGGAGSVIDSMVGGFTTNDNKTVILLTQLKSLSAPLLRSVECGWI